MTPCPEACLTCNDCFEATISGLTSQCAGQNCEDWNGVYDLIATDLNLCEWTYTSGNFSISIECSLSHWWLWIEYGITNCAIWSYPLSLSPICPPIAGEAWNWVSGNCGEGVVTTNVC